MKKFKCECCGSNSLKRLDNARYICEYCGSTYEGDTNILEPIKIEMQSNPCTVYKSSLEIPMDHIRGLGEENAAKMAITNLSRNLADAIAQNMTITIKYDPIREHQIVTASVRIVEPYYRFG